jgi:hypothetical protein
MLECGFRGDVAWGPRLDSFQWHMVMNQNLVYPGRDPRIVWYICTSVSRALFPLIFTLHPEDGRLFLRNVIFYVRRNKLTLYLVPEYRSLPVAVAVTCYIVMIKVCFTWTRGKFMAGRIAVSCSRSTPVYAWEVQCVLSALGIQQPFGLCVTLVCQKFEV